METEVYFKVYNFLLKALIWSMIRIALKSGEFLVANGTFTQRLCIQKLPLIESEINLGPLFL